MYPFSHVNFKFDGKVSCCFRSKPVITRGSENGEIWNSEGFRGIRRELAAGEKSTVCENCWKLEEGGGFSYRQESIRDHTIHARWRPALESYDSATGEMKDGPAQVEVRLSSLCNLTCRMCTPEYSSKWESLVRKNPSLERWHPPTAQGGTEAHQRAIIDFLSQHKESLRYIMFSGGEPLMQRAHYRCLEALAPFENRITLEYTTNLNMLREGSDSVLTHWPRFHRVRIKISLDADRELYPFVRVGGDIAAVEENIRTMQARFPSENRLEPVTQFPDDQVILIGTCTVSLFNVARLPETALYFTKLGLIFHTSQVQKPFHLSSQALPAAIKESITAKCEGFLQNLESELTDTWGDLAIWRSPKARQTQLYRIRKFLGNSISFMNAADLGGDFASTLEFENEFNKAVPGRGLLDVYPEWRPYV